MQRFYSKLSRSSWSVAFLGGVTVLAYLGILNAGFVWDDFPLVVDNPRVQSFEHWSSWFTEDLWSEQDGGAAPSGFYRPLVLASFAFDHLFWGGNPSGYHLQSLIWHLLGVVLMHRLLCGLVSRESAFLAATFFALHPALSEAVVWVAARNDLMATAFLLAALLCLSERRPPRRLLWGGGVCFLFALLSKESSAVGLGVLVVLDWARWGRPSGRSRYLCMGVALGGWWWLRSQAGVSAEGLDFEAGLLLLSQDADQVLGIYSRLVVWPFDLSVGRSLEYLNEPAVLTLVGVVASGIVLGIGGVYGGRLGVAGLVIVGMTFAPSLVAIASKAQIGERYLYLPFVGLSLALAAVLSRIKWSAWWWVCGVLLGFWGVQRRTVDWASDVSLWESAVASDPSPYTWGNLGHMHNREATRLLDFGDAQAESHRQEAMALFERSMEGPQPYFDNCVVLLRAPFRWQYFERGLRNARLGEQVGCFEHPFQSASFAGYYGALLAVNGHWEESLMHVERALEGPEGRGEVLRGSLVLLAGAQRGQLAPYRSYCELRPAEVNNAAVFDASVQRLLAAGGLQVDSVFDDEGRADSFCRDGEG